MKFKAGRFKAGFSLLKRAISRWFDDRAMSLAASLALYTLLSLAPLLILAVSIAGFFFGTQAAKGEIGDQLRSLLGKEAGSAIESVLAAAKEPHANMVGTIVGVAILFFGASGVFGELQDSLNVIWRVKTKPGRGILRTIRARFFSFAMVLGVAFLLLVSLVLSAALNAAGHFVGDKLPGGSLLWEGTNFVISFAIVTFLFATIFKVVPDVHIRWRDVVYGAVFTAFLFTVGKAIIGWYLGRAAVGSAYGAAGSLDALVVWVYYSAQILFLGAELTHAYAQSTGRRIVPNENAILTDDETTVSRPSHGDRSRRRARPRERATVS